MTTFSKELLVFGYMKGEIEVPVSIIYLIGHFVPEQDVWNDPYPREDIIVTNSGQTIKKIKAGCIDLEWSWTTCKQRTVIGISAIYVWEIKIIVDGEWMLGIIDSNMPKPYTCSDYQKGLEPEKCTGYYLWSSDGNIVDSADNEFVQWESVTVKDYDVITVRLDCTGTSGKLSYVHTTQATEPYEDWDVSNELGVAFTGIDLKKQWTLCLVLISVPEKWKS
eukprot:UN06789